MKLELLKPFEGVPYFTLQGFRQAAGMNSSDQVVRNLLHRWAKAGHILPLKKGVYMTRRFYEQHRGDALFTAAVSAILMPVSYVSREFILQRHNLLTEATYPVTCVTLKTTRRIVNTVGTFWYRHLRPDLYHGFTITEYYGIPIAQASPAKALFDYLYLRPIPAAYRGVKFDLAEELRLNLDELSADDWAAFGRFVAESGSRKMSEILENFRSHGWLT